MAAGIGHPWGFYFFAAVAVAGFLAVLTLPGRAAAAQAEATANAPAAEPAVGPVTGGRYGTERAVPPRPLCLMR
ncbi:hypothetical protein ABT065_30610 [Streptomyces sp. NPDC002764]|uniref:hypothetical protein n=1 Tax=Streptomyces sp. NPDC002764 TaxID=3154428 RepID=UPI003316DD2E